ncbi:MAG: FprA family A-type flavoprotein [Erysipelotrichaceae bacterium]
MHCTRKVVDDLYWVGGNDHRLALFENIHPIPRGVSYNSYLLMDEKTVLFDTVDWSIGRQFLENIKYVLDGKPLDYLIINHMEPDHCSAIEEIVLRYPNVKVISTEKGFLFMRQFGFDVDDRAEVVKEGDVRNFGNHTITFVEAPMVHWPEAMVSFDVSNGVLFSADAFGSFGALDGKLFNDEINFDRDWIDDARRYYTNIVGKYGPHVQTLLKKAGTIDIKVICPLHGPVWRSDLGYLLDKYQHWSTYDPEENGILIAYSSMYGNTESAINVLACKLVEKGMTNFAMYDVSNTHVSQLISETFKYSHMVLASVTYNLGIYPIMHNFLMDMKALHVQKRTVAIIENGSWATKSGSLMKDELNEMKQMSILNEELSLVSSMQENNKNDMDTLVDSILDSMK